MFWKFDLHTTSHIDQLLDREDVTLRELMEEDDVLQECKAQNRRLLLFLSQDHCMQELVRLITTEPPADLEERSRFKFPNIACELLTSDVSIINDKLGADDSLLEVLYHFLEQDPPLNPLLASFFSKTIGNLIARKTEQVITFLKKKEGFIGLVLKHIDASAMMDLLLRLISCVEPAPLRQEVLHWLNEEKLVQRLTELIHTGKDEERQSNASQTLCDIIRLSRDQANQMQENMEADPLLAVLESQESVAGLLKNMFDGERSEASIVNGTQVLLTLLETRRSGLEGLMDLYSQGYERSYTVSSSILNAIEPHIKDFQQLLLDPPKKSAILTTVGVLEQPLGNARLHVARLVAALLQTSALGICQELCNLSTMDLLLDLFFKYSWNNFLHFQVELCVAAILNHPSEERPVPGLQNHDGNPAASDPEPQGEAAEAGGPSDPQTSVHNALVAHLFQKCQLVQRILEAWEENDKIQGEGGTRRGNMGHLTRIANMVVQNLEKGPVQSQITDLIKELPEDCRGRWESFVDETLRETNRRNTVELVSTHNMHSSSEDDDMESPFPNDLSLQQAFSDYQIQQMTANFVDQFGFNDEEFSEHDENINATFDRIAEINFNLDADDNSANAAAFEACCKERIRQFDDAEEEEDIWEEKEMNYATQAKSRTRFGVSQTSENSSRSSMENGGGERDHGSGSDEDEDSEQNASEPNTSETDPGWTANFRESGETAASQTPAQWDSSSRSGTQTQGGGWATFTEFQPFSGTETDPRCRSPGDSGGGDVDLQAKQNHEKSDVGASSGAWPVGEGGKAPLVASDGSSSGGSDSEDDDKRAGAPPPPASAAAAVVSETAAGAPGNKTADLKRFESLSGEPGSRWSDPPGWTGPLSSILDS
ncbi:serine/threonine-protein phosphatase 6 regulatory subunit 2a [Etheostoma cragini]|uniref:serine/threonine-protein phosphatase 6 regulatory subunit 2a n=1 Tax=Etheostoma cragini TaxID=417921 RepID=UPI00155F06F8|nr:serine/threonine-protein phosphatase 6 regulatory subunit 2a [Etheostoma cragini]